MISGPVEVAQKSWMI